MVANIINTFRYSSLETYNLEKLDNDGLISLLLRVYESFRFVIL